MERGVVLHRTMEDLTGQSYLIYLAVARVKRNRVLVLVHGETRNPRIIMDVFRTYADRLGATLIAPIFDKKTSANYQRLGFNQRKSDNILPHIKLRSILDEVNRLTDIPTKRFHLFGHSGGAQFAHRYAIAFPDTVMRCAISAAGWYTFPDEAVAFPYGMKAMTGLPFVAPDIEKFLNIPMCVLVGANDTGRGSNLKKSARIDRMQGRTRLERAERWVAAMTEAARGRGLEPCTHLQVLPGAGHDLASMEARGDIGRRVSRFLFE